MPASPDPAARPQLAVSAAIFRDGKVLLVRGALAGKGFIRSRAGASEKRCTALHREVDEKPLRIRLWISGGAR